ncbi:hypothetical protein [Bacteroides sp.]
MKNRNEMTLYAKDHIPKLIPDSGFVKPGEQYVQLRYFPKKTEGF